MLPYMMQPYASGNYLTEQAMMRGANYPFSIPNPALSPWGVDGYHTTSSQQIMVQQPHQRGRLAGLCDWISSLDMVDGTLVMAGIGLTVLFVTSMIVELFRDGIKTWERNEKRKRPNFFQRIFKGKKVK